MDANCLVVKNPIATIRFFRYSYIHPNIIFWIYEPHLEKNFGKPFYGVFFLIIYLPLYTCLKIKNEKQSFDTINCISYTYRFQVLTLNAANLPLFRYAIYADTSITKWSVHAKLQHLTHVYAQLRVYLTRAPAQCSVAWRTLVSAATVLRSPLVKWISHRSRSPRETQHM